MSRKTRKHARSQGRAIYAALKSKDLRFDEGTEVEILAAGNGDTGEPSGPPKFTMLAYTGGKMRPGGWYANAPLIVDIAGMQYPNSGVIPVHRDHDTGKVVGHTTAIDAKNQLKLTGVVSASNSHADEIVGSSKNAFPWQSSIGATLLAEPQFVDEGETVYVNGRKHSGPVYVARKSRLFEASFVSLGADSRTSAVAASQKEGEDMNPFDQWLQAKGFDKETLTAQALASLQAMFDAEQASSGQEEKKAAPTAVKAAAGAAGGDGAELNDFVTDRRAAIAAELKREHLIRDRLGAFPDIAAQAIAEGWSEDKIELAHLRATAAKAPAVHVATSFKDTPNAIEAALYLTSNIGNEDRAVREYGEKTVEAARRKCPRSAGLKWLCHQVIQAAGGTAHPGVFDEDTIRETFRAERQIQAMNSGSRVYAAGGFSTISLSGTLSNLANKQLLAAYQSIPSVIPRIARVANHSDFKSHSKYRVTTTGYLDEVGASGEIQHAEQSEETYSNQVKTYGKMMALTRQMLRNDDLDAFLRIPQEFGVMAATTKEQSFFTVLLNNTDNFFATAPTGYGPNQLASGAGSALSVTSLGNAETLFYNQVDSDGKPIGLMPSILLVDSSRKRDAENICQRTTVTVAGDPTTGEQLRIGNEFVGAFEPIASPWVHNTLLTGNSATQWWLFAAPVGGIAVMEIAYLDGRQTPIIESAETDFNTLGMQWRVYHDWGIAKQDPRAGVRSPGA